MSSEYAGPFRCEWSKKPAGDPLGGVEFDVLSASGFPVGGGSWASEFEMRRLVSCEWPGVRFVEVQSA